LDIPEVSLVAILDARQGRLPALGTSLIQTAGRAARNVNGQVIMYADRTTDSMADTISETERRPHAPGPPTTPSTDHAGIHRSSIRELLQTVYERDYVTVDLPESAEETFESAAQVQARVVDLEKQ